MWRSVALVAVWALLLQACLAGPVAFGSTNVGDDRVRNTIRLALVCYGLAAAGLLIASPGDWRSFRPWLRQVRWLWSLCVMTYILHGALAFHYYHPRSHAEAYERTELISGFGPGIYLSYLFSLVWTADAVFWWIAPERYARRSPLLTGLLHSFLAFIVYNGAVIFAHGLTCWIAQAGFCVLGALLLRRIMLAGKYPMTNDRRKTPNDQ